MVQVRSRTWMAGMTLVMATAVSPMAVAQNLTVQPGFTEPLRASGMAGGLVNATDTFGESCVGQIRDVPNHVITITQAMPTLRFEVSSVEDATLVISGPGVTLCNDDTVGLAPRVEGSFQPGTYNVFVGSYQGGDFNYELQVFATPGTGGAVVPTPPPAGAVSIAPGFAPDPMVLAGVAGGPVSADSMSSACRGSVSQTPNHVVTLTQPLPFLRFSAEATSDLTLAIRGPAGVMCADDVNGFNPEVSGPMPAGTYEVFVGVYSAGTTSPYSLTLSATPYGGAGLPIPNGNGGPITLMPGFTPDPHVVSGRSGGPTSASNFGDSPTGPCRGNIAAAPNHVFTASQSFSYLRMSVQSTVDTTLVIEGPGGVRWCQDDVNGVNPQIARDFPAGTYNVWVGSYSTDGDYTLSISEFAQ